MSVNRKQADFTYEISHLIVWARFNGILLIGKELYRPPEMARIYYERGTGILSSLHTLSLALDMYVLTKDGPSNDRADYLAVGERWRTQHKLARWGGDFRRRDIYHFSFEHRGVK